MIKNILIDYVWYIVYIIRRSNCDISSSSILLYYCISLIQYTVF